MNPWESRARRARFLASGFAASREILEFYAGLAEWQGGVAPRVHAFDVLGEFMPSLLRLVSRTAPPALAQAAREFHADRTHRLLRDCWESPNDSSIEEFFARVILQPYAAGLPEGFDCRWCQRPPQAGCLRQQGDGLAFELVCPLCLRRRPFPRTRCPGCHETDQSKLSGFATPDFPHLRLLACETCRAYLVIIDLSRDPAAIPEVDELSALPLDLWAVEQGYHKLQRNIAGV